MDPSEGVFPYGNIAFKMVQELARQGRLLNNPFDVRHLSPLFPVHSYLRIPYSNSI